MEEVTESAELEPETQDGPNIKFWMAQIHAAGEAGKVHREQTRKAIDEYLAEAHMNVTRDARAQVDARFPIWWSTIRTVQPAIYSRTPVVITEKAFSDLPDELGRLCSLGAERLGKYLIRCNSFDRVFYSVRDTFLFADKATPRIRFEGKIKKNSVRTAFTPSEGEELGEDVEADETGFYKVQEVEEVEYVKVTIEPVHYSDIRHTPNARTPEEIDWMAFNYVMTRQDVAERFDKENEVISGELTYTPLGETDEDRQKKSDTAATYAKIWEIWDKRKKRVYWLAEGHNEWLDDVEDPYGLRDFFPCPAFILGTVGPDSLFPVPPHTQLQPMILQMHSMAKRLRQLIRAIRRRGVGDGSVAELDALLNDTDEAEWLLIKNFDQLVKDGGLENILKFFPTAEYAQAVTELTNIIKVYEDKFNEAYGVPDILRGVTDPNETAAAQQLKGKFLSLRFSAIQREFQRLVRDSIEMMIDLALKLFPEKKLFTIMGFHLMKPEEQQMWPQVLQLLRDDDQRMITIDIETDSTITMNQNAEIEQRNYLAKSLFEGINTIAQAAQANPAYVPVAMEAVLLVVRGLQQGKQLEASLQKAMQQAMQPQQPAPDPAMVKAQAQMQIEQQKAQMQMQIAQMKAQSDVQLALQKAQIEAELEARQTQHKMQLEQQDAQNQQQLAAVEAQTAVIKAQMEAQLEEKKAVDSAEAQKMKVIGDIAMKKMQGPTKEASAPLTVNFKPTIHGGTK